MNMNQQTKDQPPRQTHRPAATDVNKEKQQAAAREAAGRHENDGCKDQKGAR